MRVAGGCDLVSQFMDCQTDFPNGIGQCAQLQLGLPSVLLEMTPSYAKRRSRAKGRIGLLVLLWKLGYTNKRVEATQASLTSSVMSVARGGSSSSQLWARRLWSFAGVRSNEEDAKSVQEADSCPAGSSRPRSSLHGPLKAGHELSCGGAAAALVESSWWEPAWQAWCQLRHCKGQAAAWHSKVKKKRRTTLTDPCSSVEWMMGSELTAATQVRLWFWKPTGTSVEELLRFRRGRFEASMQAQKAVEGTWGMHV